MREVDTPWGIYETQHKEWECCNSREYTYKPLESNRSIQVRCATCGKFLGNARWDFRDKATKVREARQRYKGA